MSMGADNLRCVYVLTLCTSGISTGALIVRYRSEVEGRSPVNQCLFSWRLNRGVAESQHKILTREETPNNGLPL